MAKYRKKSIVIEAEQWFEVEPYVEGKRRVVDYYRTPDLDGQNPCKHCGRIMHDHGWIDTLEYGHIVCPGDWIITGIKGEKYPCKSDIFNATYEKVPELLERSVFEIKWSVRAQNFFCYHNVNTFEQLIKKTEIDILKMKGTGRKTVLEIKRKLAEFGLSLAGDVTTPSAKA